MSLDRALVLGGASSLWDDLARLEEIVGRPWPWKVYAVNQAGHAFPDPIDYWVSLHQENMLGWMARREANGFDTDFEVWGGDWRTSSKDSDKDWVDDVIPVRLVGSSGFHAIEIALHHGRDRIVGAGIPMDPRPHFHSKGPWHHALTHQKAFLESVDLWNDRFRSLSGWTRDTFGGPDREWLGI